MAKKPQRPGTHSTRTSKGTAIVGGLLIALAAIGLILLLLNHFGVAGLTSTDQSLTPVSTSTAGVLPNKTPVIQIAPLAAEGITLKQATQAAAVSQQEALLIAGQLEPVAASQAKNTSAQYLLLDYAGSGTLGAHSTMQNIPAWMIEFQQIPSSTQSSYNLYVFLDANSGKELIAVRV
jgi:hypothetical protein